MCRALSSTHSLPYYAIEKIQWKPNWVLTPEPEFAKAHEALLSKERWLIDGYGWWPSAARRISDDSRNASGRGVLAVTNISTARVGNPTDSSRPSC
jgi:hypothetical protein